MGTLLVLIYVAFISLGLPDSVMGSAWPSLYAEIGVPIEYAGIFSMIASGGTIAASLLSARVAGKYGTGKVLVVSVFLTAAALFGICAAPSFLFLCLLAIPLGLGGGAVDAALNNFVALHYAARHMNWLHSFWGVGATAGPLLMSVFIGGGGGWRAGYMTVGGVQALLFVCLLFSLPLWRKHERRPGAEEKNEVHFKKLLSIPGAKAAMTAFCCYCGLEVMLGVWGASYLVMHVGLPNDRAARFVSISYLGITIGRVLAGFLSDRFSGRRLIRIGYTAILLGTAFLVLPIGEYFKLAGFLIIGLGCAPIYPAMIHETPIRFGERNSQGLIGLQMASAYVGSTLFPPLYGMLSSVTGFGSAPFAILALTLVMILMVETVDRQVARNH